MEHIVQFAISIDDERIKKSIEANVEKEVIKKIEDEIFQSITNRTYYNNYHKEEAIKELVKKQIAKFLEENKDLILENASKILAEKLARSKQGKQLLEKLEKEHEDES